MLFRKIESDFAWRDYVILRMLRRWVAARSAHKRPLPSLIDLCEELGQPFDLAVALDSLFQLTENCLHRKLRAECCCCPDILPDELAVLALISAAPNPLSGTATAAIPHGLSGVLCWAAATVRAALGYPREHAARFLSSKCPFADAPAAVPQAYRDATLS